ncbi:hypothetical protein O6H91_07G039200 [Diphasiastrum complanatum]|uniref:Uncharacterized protein n=5 Tax=Diphasiastrum complanatum TaxID=34168 RepID=A0ACC2D4A1_DIPCM|nr:hypothetical protein O6H91_07G039200 [Diphasiastrum complanatum]KAJ7549073.1 hypothetical protein O6H91_07G039200 [Diphasiastrum complanatum]KAJ7549074.1 hypothetical protein O6H91_07G039200 [Diphasiastrum complanatum]KAJ7549075.1 hypothetical protein O6H91_07G039200 [Diphasiastrum complanatum]KAJ7549076.1 hypothetical protein O6H91_07G039200 [Diphasiastrum complanatum]
MIGFLFSLIWIVADAVTSPWRKLIWWALWLYFTSWRIAFTATLKVLNAPFRILDAVRREQQLKEELCQLQIQCEELQRKKGDAEMRLDFIAKDRRRLRESLDHTVAEWEKSIGRLKVLKARVQELESQTLKLTALKEEEQMIKNTIVGSLSTAKLAYSDTKVQNMLVTAIHNNCWDDGKKSVKQNFLVAGESLGTDVSIDRNDDMQCEGRGPAIVSSIFSALLSALVGVITYEAQDPCMPLVIALFIVVGMSLKNVFLFFSKLQNRLGFEAATLLSFNCFILGTLAFPAFPRVANFSSLVILESGKWVMSYFGMSMSDNLSSSV